MTSDMRPELKGPLPEDFPGRRALEAEGITSYGKLRKIEDLKTIPGIGPATAAEITAILEGSTETTEETAADMTAVPATPSVPTTEFTPPAAALKVVCPKCGVGGEIADVAFLGTATCGNPKHADTLLVRAT